jgi:hypothetical protein
MNLNLKLSLTPSESVVPLKNGMGQIRAVKTIVRLKNGASSEEA